jgi:RNA polymerase sigma-70 factor, ECF subfamily
LKPEAPLPPSNPAFGASVDASSGAPERPVRSRAAAAEQDERECVARARGGDEQAFRALVEAHRDRAFGLALRILRSHADAEDVAQESFVRAWQALPGFRGEAGFGTWMYRIVARQSFDRLAQLKRRRERETVIEAADQAATGGAAEALPDALRLERMMAALSAPQRAAVTLFYYEDHSVERVAETLGIPENTVKTHLSRARAILREALQRDDGREAAS